MGRPKGGEAGTTINRPMNATEKERTPQHTHGTAIVDPGHGHTIPIRISGQPYAGKNYPTSYNPTGNTITDGDGTSNDKTGIEVSVTANEGGEGYPFAYVLICQFTGS